jgi:hypothetical protein
MGHDGGPGGYGSPLLSSVVAEFDKEEEEK